MPQVAKKNKNKKQASAFAVLSRRESLPADTANSNQLNQLATDGSAGVRQHQTQDCDGRQ